MAALPLVAEWVETAQTTVKEVFWGVMRVEMALDASYIAPSVVSELGEEPTPLLALASFQALWPNNEQLGELAEKNMSSQNSPVKGKKRTLFLSSEEEEDRPQQLKKVLAGKRRKGKGPSAVVAKDMTPQPVTKWGYSEDAYLLNGKIFVGIKPLPRPLICYWCTRYGHKCSGELGKTCGHCIRDCQGCLSLEVVAPTLEYLKKQDDMKERAWRVKEKANRKMKVVIPVGGSLKHPKALAAPLRGRKTVKDVDIRTLYHKGTTELDQ
ncbi:hypothetical protein JB92DRAFT_3117925 [Gautieria morchelliformis]|nr:hypothetical protein JB92DRAFT_3117925 [Gautieria morchelliformis]